MDKKKKPHKKKAPPLRRNRSALIVNINQAQKRHYWYLILLFMSLFKVNNGFVLRHLLNINEETKEKKGVLIFSCVKRQYE